MHAQAPLSTACLLVLAYCGACDERKSPSGRDAGPIEPSPNASILPAPLASGADPPGVGKPEDAGRPVLDASTSDASPPEPRSLREDQALASEAAHDSSGLSLVARFRWLDNAPPPRTPELNIDGVQHLRDAVGFDVVIDLAGGRMRFAFASRTFTVPAGAELHARDDLYGHALLWPNRTTYTVLSPGALRSMLAEQRADVVPLVRARVSALPEGSLLGLSTERVALSTPTGKLELEQARTQNPQPLNSAWPSGVTLCHLLLELVGASPALSACRSELVPMRAAYFWPNGSHFQFEVSRYTRRLDLNAAALAMPPTGAEFRQSELPPPPPLALLSESELAELRLRPAARTDKPDPSAPKAGLLVVNHSESLRYISIDGVPAARLPPGSEQLLLGLRAGKYQLAARDFFGAEDPAAKAVEVPARFSLGDEPEKGR